MELSKARAVFGTVESATRLRQSLAFFSQNEAVTQILHVPRKTEHCYVSQQCLRGSAQPPIPPGVTDDEPTRASSAVGEALLENLIQATQDAVIFLDRSAKIVLFNPAAENMFGFSANEVLGKKINMLMPAPYRDDHDGYIERYERTGDRRAIGKIRAVEALRRSGEVFPIELSVTEMPGSELFRYAAFIRDTSEKTRLQVEVTEKKRLAAIGATAATLAHEVGNPLNNMHLHAQLAERRLSKTGSCDAELAIHLRTISEEIARLSELLEEFRMLSRRQILRIGETDLHELVAQVCRDHRDDFEASQISVALRIDETLPKPQADSSKLRQVLLNLCKNAMEAMPHGGTITIEATANDESVLLSEVRTPAAVFLRRSMFSNRSARQKSLERALVCRSPETS